MTGKTWIVVAGDAAVGNLIATARGFGGTVTAAVVGPRAVADTIAGGGVDDVLWFGEPGTTPVEAYAGAVADAIAASPGIVLGPTGPGARVLLGSVAARMQVPVLPGGTTASADGETVVVTRSVFGGIADEINTVAGPAVLLLDGGQEPPSTGSAPVQEVDCTPLGVTVVETRPSNLAHIDLGGATRVIGVGRGLGAKEDLALITELAGAADAEIACTRPLAEGMAWLDRDRYIGCSGWNISPEVYFAIGISGQLQHMVGVRGAQTIVAINSDPNAPVFADADYGLVGDLYQIVPALTKELA